MNKLYNYFKNLYNNNKISHAFLIGNVDLSTISKELNEVINSFILEQKTSLDNLDIYVLDSSEQNISKENIKDLLSKLSTTSQFNDCKVYIINECENLNDFAYNAILKTLEEPENNIYAFLITKNINSVKPTISSRCQKIFISSNQDNIVFEENIELISKELIKNIENDSVKSIAKNYNLYNIIENREMFTNILECIQNKYYNVIRNLKRDEITDLIESKNNIIEISNKILVINNNINNLKYYINKNLSIDRFIIEMWRCNNENSRN